MLQDYINEINKFERQFVELDKLTGSGQISTYKLEELINQTIDECGLQINKWNNIDGLESFGETYSKFRTTLRDALKLINEIKQKQDITVSVISVKDKIIECGQTLIQETSKVIDVQFENIINDLTDKVLLVEKEFNEKHISETKANKLIQKIKNAFTQYNVKNGDATHDSRIDFLNAIIEKSEQSYTADPTIEVAETCGINEFLDSKSSETIQNLQDDVANLTKGISEFTQELSQANSQPYINLDTIYNRILEISNSTSTGTRISNSEMAELIPILDKDIDQIRQQIHASSISTTISSELAQTLYSLSETLIDKSKKSTDEITTNENVKRIDKISTQLDLLSDLTQISNVSYFDHINHLIVLQSNQSLTHNPELQAKADANFDKGKQIHLSLAKSV